MSNQNKQKKGKSFFDVILFLMYAVSLFFFLYFLYTGLSFYLTPYVERPHHVDYRLLRPAGFRSHGLGILGTVMMLLLFLYSARKRIRFFRGLGHVAKWLKVHIFFGIMGPLFVILHSTFKVNGLISISFWSMIAVAMSGVLGRYLYMKIPHNMLGRELSYDELNQKRALLNRHLKKHYKVPVKLLGEIEQVTQRRDLESMSIFFVFYYLIKDDLTRRNKLKKLVLDYSSEMHLSGNEMREFLQAIHVKAKMDGETFLWKRIHSLFHYWHVIHKPFAYIMLLIMFVHVVVSIMMGYTWL